MAIATIAGIASAIAGLGSLAYNAYSNQVQNERNMQLWERENTYNNPINQVSRLKQAGLSPSLMYKNGVDGLTSAPSPEMSGIGQVDPVSASQIALNTAQANAVNDANDRENQKQGFNLQNLDAIVKQNQEMIGLLKNQNTKTQWEGEYMRLLGDSENWRSKMLFQDWYAGFQTLNYRINNIVERLEEDTDRARRQHNLQVPEFNAKYSEYVMTPNILHNNVQQGIAMIDNVLSSTYSNYQGVNIGWFNADSSRMNAYTNAWNAQTSEYDMLRRMQETRGYLQNLSQQTQALINSNSIFDAVKVARIGSEYTGMIGNIFGASAHFSYLR